MQYFASTSAFYSGILDIPGTLSLFLSLSFAFLLRRWPEEEGRVGAASIAQSLRHQSVQDVDQQKDQLPVSRYSVGERRPRVKRRTNMRELGLWSEVEMEDLFIFHEEKNKISETPLNVSTLISLE